MSRILLSLLSSIVVLASLASSTVCAQSECPKEEIIIFGSAYGYTTSVCNKKGKECSESPSSTILFFPNKVKKVGCADAPKCDSCATALPKAAKSKGNFVYTGRQIFLDTTAGVSNLGNLQFAMVEGDKSDTHYAVFEIQVAYNLKGQDPIYFACPIALQLPGDPTIPGPLKAANKTVEGETHLVVTDGKTKKETSYKIVEARGDHGIVRTKLLRTLKENPVPAAPKPAVAKPAAKSPTPTPAKRRRVTPEEDK